MAGATREVVGVVQARMGSTRLPGKAILPLGGKPMVVAVAARARLARSLDALVVAIPFQDEDLNAVCMAATLPVVRGSEQDLIERYLRVFDAFPNAGAVCRITADEPLIDPGVIDLVVTSWRERGGDYCSNARPGYRTWPDGLDVEVIARPALETLNRLTRAKSWLSAYDAREELTRTFWERPGLFRVHGIMREPDGLDRLQWSVNTPEEYRGAEIVYDTLELGFRWQQVLQVFGPMSLSDIAEPRSEKRP